MRTPKCSLEGCNNTCRIDKKGNYKLHCSRSHCAKDNALKSIDKRKQSNIEKYGVPHPIASDSVRAKIQTTIKNKYGVDNVSQIDQVKTKKKNTLLHNYGVDHPLKSKEIKSRVRDTMISRYGVDHVSYIGKTREQIELLKDVSKIVDLNKEFNLYSLSRQYGFSDRTLREILENNGVDPIHHFKSSFEKEIRDFICSVGSFDIEECKRIDGKEIDLYIPELSLGIECNGAYWHSEVSGARDRLYHLDKTLHFSRLGIKIVHIWDYQWYQKNDLIKSMLSHYLNASARTFARKTTISNISTSEEIEFLNENHIQGYVPSDFSVCLKEKDRIMSLMTFKRSRYKKDIEWELLRFCNRKFTSVVGGASKLLNYFIKNQAPNSIISYSHRHISNGGLYEKLGFLKERETYPSYYYTKDYKRFHNRITFQKHKLQKLLVSFDNNLTEWENMKNNGYDRIWDCGNDVWILHRN